MQKVKCLVWDLDNTLWDGILTEDKNVSLKAGVKEIIKGLDERGILQSIASKNNFEDAYKKLEELGISEYFLYPQINWGPKSASIKRISEQLNLGIDSFAFADDSPFERGEVAEALPQVLCIDAADMDKILDDKRFIPRFITEDTVNRRKMYMADYSRRQDEESFDGTSEEFLKGLDMVLSIAPVTEHDLQRAYELTVRTHQLNSTGYTYSYDELKEFINSEDYIFLIAQLTDKYGDYGKIGLILVENTDVMRIKLLLMSCRVMSRGVGSALLIYLEKLAKKEGKRLLADFLATDRNRVMYITYKFMGFDEIEEHDGASILEYTSEEERDFPPYFTINTEKL
ncbi:MAG: HAD-IIIC family phosphatase [Clostridiales bacterium]|nr:HAD-IIIC family phosphatase [Clostridiales bacterium]